MNLSHNTHNCAICLEELTIPCINSCITECDHVFHLNCLIRNIEHNTRCPICRKHLLIRNLHNDQQNINDSDRQIIRQNMYIKYYLMICLLVFLYYIFQGLHNNGFENMYDTSEEILIENQLNNGIRDIISSFTNMKNNQIEPLVNQIQNVCIQFGNRSLHYFRNIFQYDINYLNYDMNHFHSRIVQIVNNATNKTITLDQIEIDIRNLCFNYTESIIFDIK